MISVFLPCYNEEKILESHITQVYQALKKLNIKFEIIIVNDGSTDNTSNIAEKLKKEHKEIKHFYYSNGPSRRENLAEAFKKAEGEIIIFMDMDLAVGLDKIKNLVDGIGERYDIVIGSRRVPGSVVIRSFKRRIYSFIYHKSLNIFFNSSIGDYQCGFKAFRKNVILDLIKKIGYDSKFIRGWFWDADILINAERMGYKIKQIPITWNAGKASSFRVKREIKMIPYIIKLRFKLPKKKCILKLHKS